MRIISEIVDLRAFLQERRHARRSIGFVPSMGFLHEGHVALLRASKDENDLTVLSIYVNPSQFGPNEDLERYPRDMDRDLALAESEGVDVVFAPSNETMYPKGLAGQVVWIDPGRLGSMLEGEFRNGHFRGVATVVDKLLHMVGPSRVYLGQKDAQQAVVITRMIRDLAFDVEVRVVPTVREPDGLALSSRNVYLSPEERAQAPVLFKALYGAKHRFESGQRSSEALVRLVKESLARDAPLAQIDYVALVDKDTLLAVEGDVQQYGLLCLAARFGKTRLIDNVVLEATQFDAI